MAALVAVATASLLISPVASAIPSPSDEVGAQIIGGQPATEAHGATLLSYQGRQRCGALKWGAADSRHSLSAAHCMSHTAEPPELTPGAPGDFSLRSGSLNRESGGVLTHGERIKNCPTWNWGNSQVVCDVSYIRTATAPNTLSMTIAKEVTDGPIKLLGWGYTSYPPTGPPPVDLQELEAWILPDHECAPGAISAGELCVGSDSDTGACFGDSGGPMIQWQKGRWVAIGITSRGTGPGCAEGPAIYTDLTYFRTWLLLASLDLPVKPPADSTQPVPAEVLSKRQHWTLAG